MSTVLPINEVPRWAVYTASEGQTAFAIPFVFQSALDITVGHDVDGVFETIGSGYAITGAGNPSGGTLTFAAGRTAGDRILVLGEALLERLSSIVKDGRFSSASIDSDFDRLTLIAQELSRDRDRAVKAEYGQPGLTIASGIGEGKSLIKRGGRLEEGPTADQIEHANDDALAAEQSKIAAKQSEASAAGYASSAGQATGRLIIRTFDELERFVYATPDESQQEAAPGDVIVNEAEGASYSVLAQGTPSPFPSPPNIDLKAISGASGFTSRQFNCHDGKDNSSALNYLFAETAAAQAAGLPCRATLNGNENLPIHNPISLSFTAVAASGAYIDFSGARLVSTIGSGEGPVFSVGITQLARNIELYKLNIRSSGAEDGMVDFNGGADGSGGGSAEYNYLWKITQPILEGFTGYGLMIRGNSFEGSILQPNLAALDFRSNSFTPGPTNIPLLLKEEAGKISSINVHGGTIRQGYRGLEVQGSTPDLGMWGTSIIQSWHEGAYVGFMSHGIFEKVHFENNWMHDTGATIQPALWAAGGGTVNECREANNGDESGHANAVVRLFADDGANWYVSGVTSGADVPYLLAVGNASDNGGRIVASGMRRNKIYLQNEVAGNVLELGGNQIGIRYLTASGTINLDTVNYQTFQFVLTGDVTLTAPTYPIAGDRITIVAIQPGSGTPFALTFPAGFHTSRPLAATLGLRTKWDFTYVPSFGWVSE